MTRSRKSAKAAGSRSGFCDQCGLAIPKDALGRNIRKYCSNDCLNAHRRARHVPKPRAPKQPLADRLWSRIIVTATGCWEWQGYRMPSGHGQIGIGHRKVTTTHRVAWELAHGTPVPDGLMVRHHCDNPPCINPEHLDIGTAADNYRDAVERNRVARGFRLPGTRLSPDDVREIRRIYSRSNASALAQRHGVSAKYIRAVAHRQERADVS